MAQSFSEAEAVETIAKQLIPVHHPHLSTAVFRFLFKEKGGKKGGKPVLGTVKKTSDQLKYLLEVDFIMDVPINVWNESDPSKRTALVDHLLEDEKTAEMKWTTREPDVHEFSNILRRHGAWTEELSGFVSVAKTVDLSFMTSDEGENEDETVSQTVSS